MQSGTVSNLSVQADFFPAQMSVMVQCSLFCMVHLVIVLSLRFAIAHTFVSWPLSTPLAADRTGDYVRQLLEPALTSVPLAADIPSMFQSALYRSGTLPFPVPDVFYELQRRQDSDMKFYLAPLSLSGAVAFSSTIHAVLLKDFPTGSEMVQACWFFTCIFALLACALPWTVFCARLFWAVMLALFVCWMSANIPLSYSSRLVRAHP